MEGKDMTDLDKLIEAVEGGDDGGNTAALINNRIANRYHDKGGYWPSNDVMKAFDGSLDAAISLYDSLLGHDAGWTVSQHIAKVVMGEFGADGVYESVIPSNPARALLLSTLKAYRSQQ